MLNTQPREKTVRATNPSGAVEVIKCWPTIQGEGPFVGKPAVFIRLAGCNLDCSFCDTQYTIGRLSKTPSEVLDMIVTALSKAKVFIPNPLVVLTGGEPLRQDIGPLCSYLGNRGIRVQIETNGTLYLPTLPFRDVTIVCSPKTKYLNPKLQPHIAALKYVIQDGFVDPMDGLPIKTLGNEGGVARPHPNLPRPEIYVQPLDEQDPNNNAKNLAATVQSCLQFGHRLCLQMHKIANLE